MSGVTRKVKARTWGRQAQIATRFGLTVRRRRTLRDLPRERPLKVGMPGTA